MSGGCGVVSRYWLSSSFLSICLLVVANSTGFLSKRPQSGRWSGLLLLASLIPLSGYILISMPDGNWLMRKHLSFSPAIWLKKHWQLIISLSGWCCLNIFLFRPNYNDGYCYSVFLVPLWCVPGWYLPVPGWYHSFTGSCMFSADFWWWQRSRWSGLPIKNRIGPIIRWYYGFGIIWI